MMTCPFCGAPQQELTANCLYCGVRLPPSPDRGPPRSSDGASDLDRLRERWDQMKVHVANCAASHDHNFHGTMAYWSSGYLPTRSWSHRIQADLVHPSRAEGEVTVLVEGSCRAPVELPGRALLHVHGDVDAPVAVGEMSEVVVAGDVGAEGAIEVRGMGQVFVGGTVHGRVRCTSSLTLFVMGSLTGTLETGSPRTSVFVAGDFLGTARPAAEGSGGLFDLRVGGYLPQATAARIPEQGFTTFVASAGQSDLPPGIYQAGHSGFWVVRRPRRTP